MQFVKYFEYSTTNNAAYLLWLASWPLTKAEFHIRLIDLYSPSSWIKKALIVPCKLNSSLSRDWQGHVSKAIAEYCTERQLAETVPKNFDTHFSGQHDRWNHSWLIQSKHVGLVFTFDGTGFGVNFKNVIEQQLQKEGQKETNLPTDVEILGVEICSRYEMAK